MKKIPVNRFKRDVDRLLKNAIQLDEFLTVHTDYGDVVVVSKEEWNTLNAGFQLWSMGKRNSKG